LLVPADLTDSFDRDLEESAWNPERSRAVSASLPQETHTGAQAIEVVWVERRTMDGVVEEQTAWRDLRGRCRCLGECFAITLDGICRGRNRAFRRI
jgi:hypothetical protein